MLSRPPHVLSYFVFRSVHANRHFPVGRPAGPAESLFAMYTDPAKHAAITGAPVAISVEPGSPFQAFNGALTGATLEIIPQRLVIQSWRSTKFNGGDPDSTLILAFTQEGTNGRIVLGAAHDKADIAAAALRAHEPFAPIAPTSISTGNWPAPANPNTCGPLAHSRDRD